MTSISDALTYPTEHEDWLKTILIGGVLSFLGFLLLPLLPVYGYVVRAIRRSLEGDPQPPIFDEWGELFTDGLQALVIGIVYMLIPLLVGAITVGGSLLSVLTGTRGGVAAGLAGFAVGALIVLVLSLIFGYLAVAALVNFARTGEFGAAFDFGTLREVAFDGEYAVAWLLSVAVFIGAGVVSSVLNFIPIIGTVISAFVFFYAQIVAAPLWASGYTAARQGDVSGGGSPGEAAI